MDQDDQQIQQFYLEALARVEAQAAEIAFELGLASLGLAIRESVRAAERELQDLLEAQVDADKSRFSCLFARRPQLTPENAVYILVQGCDQFVEVAAGLCGVGAPGFLVAENRAE